LLKVYIISRTIYAYNNYRSGHLQREHCGRYDNTWNFLNGSSIHEFFLRSHVRCSLHIQLVPNRTVPKEKKDG